MRTFRLTLSLLSLFAGASLAAADGLVQPGQLVEQVVDHYLDARLQEEGIAPAGPADDATLIRRLTLDLAGRIPTVEETRAFAASSETDKRVRLVERLMASPAFVRHQATELDVMLMNGTRGSVRGYLLAALTENRSWDRIYRDLMLPDEKGPNGKSASKRRSRSCVCRRLT